MSRLYGITYNEDQWECKKDQSNRYYLINKKTSDSYHIRGSIIGIEQVDDNSFLVYRDCSRSTYEILRVKLASGLASCLFSKVFQKFYFLTEDTILFDNSCVYSISQNCEVQEFNWLKYQDLTIYTDKDDNFIFLLLKQYISASRGNDYVQVFIDTKTFKPITCASSSLRDNHNIVLSDSFTFKDLVLEDEHYAKIIYKIYDSVNTGQRTLLERLSNDKNVILEKSPFSF